jgi:hypothetical protein
VLIEGSDSSAVKLDETAIIALGWKEIMEEQFTFIHVYASGW